VPAQRPPAAGIDGDQIDNVSDEGLDARQELAITLLVGVGIGIQLADESGHWWYIDGQHRVVAQLDQGVKQTIIQRLELLDPDTGQPAPD
jgi:hypothetical protein